MTKRKPSTRKKASRAKSAAKSRTPRARKADSAPRTRLPRENPPPAKAKAPADALFTADERDALRPPEDLKPSEWAERYRILPIGASNIPGPWRNDNAPYLRGLMDLANAPGVVQLNTMKAGQIGVSEAGTNCILYWAHTDPDPVGLALPDKIKGRKIISERLIPAIQSCAPVASLVTDRKWDLSSEKVKLANGFLLHLMWSGSASATSSDPMRRVIDDEVDKFAEWAGRETNPVGRTWTRTRSYGPRRFQWNISTPTDRMGQIFRLLEACGVQLLFMVPCPGCNAHQFLTFRQLKWSSPDKKLSARERLQLADRLVADNDVWYECVRCKRRIEPSERPAMVRAGLWRDMEGAIPDAEAVEEWPRGTRIGTRVSAMSCLWQSWAGIAAEFIRAATDRERMFSFRTETVGEPWEEQLEKPRASVYSDKCARAKLPEGVVPAWAVKLLATVDSQHDHFYVVLRAWGPDMRSQRVFHARAETFAELDDVCLQHVWPVEGQKKEAEGPEGTRRGAKPELVLIDSGGTRLAGEEASRTMQVYRWVMRRSARVRAIKGAGAVKRRREGLYLWPGKGVLDDGRSASKSLRIWYVDTHHFGDLLNEMVHRGLGEDNEDEEVWLLNQEDDEEYNTQLANVQKRLLRSKRGPPQEVWEPIETGAPNHYWDCEAYQVAAAYLARVHMLPSAAEMERFREAERSEHSRQQKAGRSRKKAGRSGWDVRDMRDHIK